MDSNLSKDLYRIGTVASLTGISVERLRAWERRYELTPAHKSGRTRFYSKDQLERLKLIKHLIDQGQPISSLVDLSYTQLLDRAALEDESSYQLDVLHQPTVGLIGPNLLLLEQQAHSRGPLRLEVVGRWANMDAFAAEQMAAVEPQLMIVQLPVLSMQPIELIKDNYENLQLVVIYQFATAKTLSQFEQTALPTLKWPLTWSEIEHTAIAELGSNAPRHGASPRRFSDEELIALAAETEDDSGCTQYLIEAINQLNAFSAYAHDTAQALPRGQLYRQIQNDTSFARQHLEATLEAYVEALSGQVDAQQAR